MRPASATTLDSSWSVRNGVLYYGGSQIFLRADTSRLGIASPAITSPSYDSPVTIVPCDSSSCLNNWSAVVTSVFPIVPSPSPPSLIVEYDLTRFRDATTNTNQLAAQAVDAVNFKPILVSPSFTEAGGRAARPALYLATNTIHQVSGGVDVTVPLNGLVPLADIGSVESGTVVPVADGSKASAASEAVAGPPWWWYLIIVLVVLAVGAALFWVITRKRTTTTPLLEDPLVLGAMALSS